MPAAPSPTTYRFDIGERSAKFTVPAPAEQRRALPVWTELEREQCPDCPLTRTPGAHCPAAAALAPIVEQLGDLRSTDRVRATVTTPQRTVSKDTDLQEALRSLVGLVLSSSACPVLATLAPLARHHLPFATAEETLFRAASLFAMRDRFGGGSGDDWLTELRALYRQLGAVNRSLAARLRSACDGDAGVNALVQLFSLTLIVEDEAASNLEELRDAVARAFEANL